MSRALKAALLVGGGIFVFVLALALVFLALKKEIPLYVLRANIGEGLSAGKITGAIFDDKVEYKDVVWAEIEGLPDGSAFYADRITVHWKFPNIIATSIDIQNGRLLIKGYEPILVYGNVSIDNVAINIYIRRISGNEIEALWGRKLPVSIGELLEVDITTQGPLSKMHIKGTVKCDEVKMSKIAFRDLHIDFNVAVDAWSQRMLAYEISTSQGRAALEKGAVIDLMHARIAKNEVAKSILLNAKGKAQISNYDISIILNGTFDNPNIVLSSNPPASQARLLSMLILGKAIGIGSAFSAETLSLDVVKDVLDYLVFGNRMSTALRKIGITGFSIVSEEDKYGFGVRSSLGGMMTIDYIGKSQKDGTGQTHAIGAGVNLTKNVEIGVKREITIDNTDSAVGRPSEIETKDEVTAVYRKRF